MQRARTRDPTARPKVVEADLGALSRPQLNGPCSGEELAVGGSEGKRQRHECGRPWLAGSPGRGLITALVGSRVRKRSKEN
jgi:hypothetical protein